MSKNNKETPKLKLTDYQKVPPFPLLSESRTDFIPSCRFSFDYENLGYNSKREMMLTVTYNLDSKYLKKYIEDEKAVVVLNMRCGHTSWRKQVIFDKESSKLNVFIPATNFYRDLTIEVLVVAKEQILDYTCWSEFNPKFYPLNSRFYVEPGDILASTLSVELKLNTEDCDISQMSSFQKISGTENGVKFRIDYEGDILLIYMDDDYFNSYTQVCEMNSDLAFSLFMTGPFVEVIHTLQNDTDGIYSGNAWAEDIEYTFRKCFDTDMPISSFPGLSATDIQQRLFNDISERTALQLLSKAGQISDNNMTA